MRVPVSPSAEVSFATAFPPFHEWHHREWAASSSDLICASGPSWQTVWGPIAFHFTQLALVPALADYFGAHSGLIRMGRRKPRVTVKFCTRWNTRENTVNTTVLDGVEAAKRRPHSVDARMNTGPGTKTTTTCWRMAGVRTMCEKCRTIDVNIARCTRLRDQLTDEFFIEGLTDLMKSYSAEKATLHPAAVGGPLPSR